MNNFLEKLLKEEKYELVKDELNLWGNTSEYFIIKDFNMDFFDSLTKEMEMLIFDFQKLDNAKIKKNTSLFILIKVDNVNEFYNQNLNTILTIEEDEYYFRKYVIFYTEEGLDKLNPDIQWLLRYIRGNGNDSDEESLFDKFERNMFFDDAYFIAMQLIIKLPFISLPHSNDHFETIEDKIKLRIGTAELVDQEQQVDQILGLFHDDNINIGSQLEDTTIIDSLRQILEE